MFFYLLLFLLKYLKNNFYFDKNQKNNYQLISYNFNFFKNFIKYLFNKNWKII